MDIPLIKSKTGAAGSTKITDEWNFPYSPANLSPSIVCYVCSASSDVSVRLS